MVSRRLDHLDPSRLTSQATTFRDDADFPVFGEPVYRNPVDIPIKGELVVIAIGKAAIGMAAGAQIMFGDRFQRGYVLTVDGPDDSALDERWSVYRASHPIPDQRGIDATRALIERCRRIELGRSGRGAHFRWRVGVVRSASRAVDT